MAALRGARHVAQKSISTFSSPLVIRGVVFFGSADGSLYALE